jgi:transposase
VATDYETLLQDIRELRVQLAHKTTLVESLTAEVLRLRRWTFGRSAEKVDLAIAPELPLESTATRSCEATTIETAAALSPLRTPPRLIAVDTAPGRSGARRVPRELPAELPRVIQVHAPSSCQCPDCGAAMRRLGEDTSEQLDYVPGYFQVIRHVRPKLACGACARIVQAAAPSRPIERGLPTAALLAQVIGAKYADHCPLYRQEGIYRRAGVELQRATLASWVGETAKLLDPLVAALERYVLEAEKLHADDTPVPVLEPGKGRTRTARLWAYVRDDRPAAGPDPPAVVYRYSPDRRGEHPQTHLATFTGALQADGYGGFTAIYGSGRVREAACWAHARRKYYDVYVAERSPAAYEALTRIGALYAIEREIRGQPPAVRVAARRQRAAPLLASLRDWLRGESARLSAKAPLAGAIQYTLVRWEALTRYCEDGVLEIDNNAAERAIRALVLGRRNYLFAGSDAGGESAARLYSLIGTCRLNGIDPHRYLRHVLERIAEKPINRVEELLPWRVAPALIVPLREQAA